MYVVVVYDANPAEGANLRSVLRMHLHWIQESAFAGELTRTAAEDLFRSLKSSVQTARVEFWLFDRAPEIRYLGTQEDRESIFL